MVCRNANLALGLGVGACHLSGLNLSSSFHLTAIHVCPVNPHVELVMAPHAGFDTDLIKQKARKDLLNLLEGVSKAWSLPLHPALPADRYAGSREEESGP